MNPVADHPNCTQQELWWPLPKKHFTIWCLFSITCIRHKNAKSLDISEMDFLEIRSWAQCLPMMQDCPWRRSKQDGYYCSAASRRAVLHVLHKENPADLSARQYSHLAKECPQNTHIDPTLHCRSTHQSASMRLLPELHELWLHSLQHLLPVVEKPKTMFYYKQRSPHLG